MIRNPLSMRALSSALKIVYFSVSRPTHPSRNRYRPSRKEAMAPRLAPIQTAAVPSRTPHPRLPRLAEKTKPAPSVRMDPGTKNMVAKKYRAMKAKTPATTLFWTHSRKATRPLKTHLFVRESMITKMIRPSRKRPIAIFLMHPAFLVAASSSAAAAASVSSAAVPSATTRSVLFSGVSSAVVVVVVVVVGSLLSVVMMMG
mmetsp:Transcript_7936/g.19740  ORF Transcript_7936/g.19740 Transcript_7936/m.19740 type:complete len:201 (+) Transcript_7936:627-1229(+)